MAQSVADSLTSTGMIPSIPPSALGMQDTSGFDDASKKYGDLVSEEQKNAAYLRSQGSRIAGSIEESRKEAKELEPPKIPELTPVPQPKQSDPLQAFGSSASWLAVFGSLLTRTPLTTALNASAGVMNAWKQQDAASAQHQFEMWKASTDNAIKLHNFEMESYQAAMAKLTDDQKAGAAEMTALAASFKDDGVLMLSQKGMTDEAVKLIQARDNQFDKMTKVIPQLELANNLMTLKSSPDFQKLSPEDKNKKIMEMTNTSVAAAEIKGSAKEDATKKKDDDKYDTAIDQLESIKKKVMDGGGMGVTGLAGYGQRLAETVATITPGVGNRVPTPASDLQAQVSAMQLELPKLLTGTSKSAEDERIKVQTILRGLNPGDTKDKTLNSIDQLINIFKERKGERSSEESSDDLGGLSDDELKQKLGIQ